MQFRLHSFNCKPHTNDSPTKAEPLILVNEYYCNVCRILKKELGKRREVIYAHTAGKVYSMI